MALVLADRVQETTSAPGTGTATLLGAVTGYRTFSTAIGNGNTTYYTITDQVGGANWEVGLGTVGAGTLARTTVLASSNGGSLTNFSTGTQNVFCDYPATQSVYSDNTTAAVTQSQWIANKSTTGNASQGAFAYGTLGFSDQNVLASFQSSVNNYNQVVIQNTSSGVNASADLIINNNLGSSSAYYASVGMNSSGWTGTLGTSSLNAPNVCYFTSTSSDLVLGTTTANSIRFVTNSGADQLIVDTTNNWTLSGTTLTGTSNLALASAGNMNFAARSTAGKLVPTWRGPSGLPYSAQAGIGNMQWQEWAALGNATTAVSLFRATTPTAAGTATARNVASTSAFTRARRLGYVTAATAGLLAQLYESTAAQFALGDGTSAGGFYFVARFGISDAANVTGARMFVGMTSSIAAATNVEPNTLTNAVGLAQLSTDSTQLYIVYGGSAAQTAVGLGTNFPPTFGSANWFEFIMYAPTNSVNTVYYQINNLSTGTTASGTLTGTAGTVLPANTTFLAPRLWRTNNATALAVGLDIGSVYIETDM